MAETDLEDEGTEETSTTEQGISNGWHKVYWGTAGLYRSPCGSVAKNFHAGHWVFVHYTAGTSPECHAYLGAFVRVSDNHGNWGYMRAAALR